MSGVTDLQTRRATMTKMHGAQNVFWLFDARRGARTDFPALARRVCLDAASAADGVLVVGTLPGATAEMRIFNADGGEAEMCGNGMRCVARFLAEDGAGDRFVVATPAGPIPCEILARRPAWEIAIDLGQPREPRGSGDHSIAVGGSTYAYTFVSLGNPHAVIFVDDVERIDLPRLGAAIEHHPEFPDGVNLHIAQRTGRSALRARHWERGVGVTQACGTGAVACAVAARRRMGMGSPVDVDVPGGRLRVTWEPGSSARLIGGAEHVEVREFDLIAP